MTLVTTRRAAVLALCATALVFGTPDTAAAKGKTETVHLVPPDHSPDADATGKIKIVHRRKGDRMIVRVKRLAPKTTFEVRDADTDELLGTLRTNKRGRGRLVLSEGKVRKSGKVAAVDTLPDDVEIVEQGDDDCVLEMEGDGALVGDAHYEGRRGHEAWIALLSIPAPDVPRGPPEGFPADRPDVMPPFAREFDDVECFILSLVPPPEGDERVPRVSYELFLDSLSGDEMPLGVAHAADLAERAFEIRAGDGTVWIAGTLPAVGPPERGGFEPPVMPDPPGRGGPPEWDGDQPRDPRFLGPPERAGGPGWEGVAFFDTAPGDRPNADGPPPDGWDEPGWDGPGWDVPGWRFPEPEESDVTIWIADEDGVLTAAGHLWRLEMPVWDCPPHDGDEPNRPPPGDEPARPAPGDGADGPRPPEDGPNRPDAR